MHDREPTIMNRLLERLLAARARRDHEERFSDAWQAADLEMHAIERAIFRVPVESPHALERPAGSEAPAPTWIHEHGRHDAARGSSDRYESERAG